MLSVSVESNNINIKFKILSTLLAVNANVFNHSQIDIEEQYEWKYK